MWLDLPRATVMRQLIRRSLIRAILRQELWNGNRDGFRDWLSPGHPIRSTWRRHAEKREATGRRVAAHPGVSVIRLTTARAARDWVAQPLPVDVRE